MNIREHLGREVDCIEQDGNGAVQKYGMTSIVNKVRQIIADSIGEDGELDRKKFSCKFGLLKEELGDDLPTPVVNFMTQVSALVMTCVENPENCRQNCSEGPCRTQ